MHPEVDSLPGNAADSTGALTTEQLETGIETWPGHIRKKRNIADLNVCNCGNVVSPNEADIIECKRVGCETSWVSYQSQEYCKMLT